MSLEVKDYSVSGEKFQLVYNKEWEALETHPKPNKEDLPKYYKSEDYISHTDSKRNLFENIYHLIKQISLKRKIRLINSFNVESKHILDVGCGTGDFLDSAKKNGWHAVGVEPNENARDLAKKKVENSVFNIDKLSEFKDASFDVITLWHVLEHLYDLEHDIKCFKALLKPNGRLVIAVPNHKSFDAKHYKNFWAAYDVPRHLWHFSKNSFRRIAEREQLNIEKVLPMRFDAYYVSLLSEKYKTGKMNPLRAFSIGLTSNLRARFSGEYSSLIYVLKKQ